jgi:hypothetical protein
MIKSAAAVVVLVVIVVDDDPIAGALAVLFFLCHLVLCIVCDPRSNLSSERIKNQNRTESNVLRRIRPAIYGRRKLAWSL